jgi:hydrogenase maturation factor HypF (carbamoyltransferase family)
MDNYRKVRGKIDGSSFSIRGWTSDTGAAVSIITFSKDEAKRLYMKCFGRPLAQLYSVLRKNAKLGTDVAVVLNGGTFSNAHISRQTRKKIEDLGLKYLPWTNSIAVDNRQ